MKNPAQSHIRLTRIQKLIGRRMLSSKLSKPCFYICSRADVTELMAIRHKLSKSLGVKITSNAFFIRSLGLAAKRYPIMTGALCGDAIRISDAVNVGFAVNSPQGLVVPVVKNADRKTLAEIALEDKLFTEKARSNKLTLADMEGETIALSNLGAYGIDSFLGIVPPPAGTILACGNVVKMIVPRGGCVMARKFVSLSLAVDDRIADGTHAAQFLGCIIEQLEDPRKLI
ncbi:MAG: 2-oxo acid dehydrogenase subunit E2 [Phycisphaerales bacterium]|nr:MAG: 2-oxo acid dehydrogenase subunit E2 [Phycisphaerales bacterium]